MPILVPSLYVLPFPGDDQNQTICAIYTYFPTSCEDEGGTVGKPDPDNGGVGLGSRSLPLPEQKLFEGKYSLPASKALWV